MKSLGVVAFVFALLILASSFVSAQETLNNIVDGANSFYTALLEPLGKFLLGSNTDSGELFFAKLLIFILLIAIISQVISQLPLSLNKYGFLISFIVSILAVRFLNADWISTIILPYSVLGIALTSIFPLIIYFFFVEKSLSGYPAMRKIAWIFAGVVFVGLFIYRANGEQVIIDESTGFNASYVYLITAVLCFIFLLMDKTIQKAFIRAKHDQLKESVEMEGRANLLEKLNKMQKQWVEGHMPDSDYKKLITKYRSQAEFYGLPLPDVSHL